jgi:hypothetical protein
MVGQCLLSIAVITLAWYARDCGSIPREGSGNVSNHYRSDAHMRKIVVLLAMLSMMVFPSVAFAHTQGASPHNDNGNNTVDLYWTADFNGYVGNAMDDFNDTPDRGNMPLTKRVLDKDASDIYIFFDTDLVGTSTGAYFKPTHNDPNIPDRIGVRPPIGDGGPHLESPFAHELLHAYGDGHKTTVSECNGLVGGSAMCVGDASAYNPKKLSLHDNTFLRNLPNDWQGGSGYEVLD